MAHMRMNVPYSGESHGDGKSTGSGERVPGLGWFRV